MSGTKRALAIPGRPVVEAQEMKRWRAARDERIARNARDAKRAARADRYSDRRAHYDEDEELT